MLTYFRTGQYCLNRGSRTASSFPRCCACPRAGITATTAITLAPSTQRPVADEMDAAGGASRGCRRSRSSCSTAATALHGQPDRTAASFLHDRPRRDLRPRALRVHHARGAAGSASAPGRLGLAHQREPALRARRNPERLHQARRARGHARRACAPTARRARRTPKGLAMLDRVLPGQRDRTASTSTCCTSRSRKAMDAALMMADVFPHINFQRESDGRPPAARRGQRRRRATPRSTRRSVPARTSSHLWRAVLDGKVDWIVSDHACCSPGGQRAPDATDAATSGSAKSGFGGTEYLLAGVFSEGASAAWPLTGWPSCVAWNPGAPLRPARQGRHRSPGFDADLALLDPERRFAVRAADSPSGQGLHTVRGPGADRAVTATFLRGRLAWENGAVAGARGRYIARPTGGR